ncbi:MAG: glutamate racemase [Methylovirgula sp.]
MPQPPKILVFDSGLGGLTVLAEAMLLRPDGLFLYAADDAGFPYGLLSEEALVARVNLVMERLVARFAPDLVVIACNTASTLVLPHLRAHYPQLPFVGTVPAVKPAAALSRSQMISVLATPGTVTRDYTRDLVRTYAAHCDVTLVGSDQLAGLAEAFMKGETVADAAIASEIAPCFVANGAARTDCIVLACTHYPLLLAAFERLAPWPVDWIDPAQAIARRVDHVLGEDLGLPLTPEKIAVGSAPTGTHIALFTSASPPGPALEKALHQRGLGQIILEPIPLEAN